MVKLNESAKEILALNWRDGFTVPSEKLYPFQWNWDSGFVAMGLSHYDLDKAMQELHSLFSGQWENGMVPHIIFHSEQETSYFPNYDFWNSAVNKGAPQKPKSSGITQPPVHGFVLENLLHQHPDHPRLLDFAKSIFPKIVHSHQFFYNYRDPNKEGLFFIYHPWESGRDNSPIWDESLDRIKIIPGALPAYSRRDTNIADASERPTHHQYDRYVYLVELGKKYAYDGPEIAQESPFLIQDCMMNAILIKSNESLIRIADRLGFDKGQLQEWNQQSISNFNNKFWNEDLDHYSTYDLSAGKQIQHKEIGGLTPIYAGLASEEQAASIAAYLKRIHQRGYYLCPSFDIDSPLFDSKRYWRGPVWPHMNWMLYHGLNQYGHHELAEIVKSDLMEIVGKLGFYEYYESEKAKFGALNSGYGGAQFSWTATIIINFINNN